MSLKPKLRGNVWWAFGRVRYNGRPITGYIRRSTGSSSEAGARDWIRELEEAEIRRHLLGEEAQKLTVGGAIRLYDAKPAEAKKLLAILEAEDGQGLLAMPVERVTGKFLRELGRKLKPDSATDTMWREVVSPLRAVINNSHDLGKCPPIRVKRYSENERIAQDVARGRQSRVERVPSTREWVEAFCAAADPWNAAMLRFMFETAARIDQAVSLEPRDLDLMNHRVRLKAQKGHPAQWVTISHEMMIELANLPAKRPKNRKTGSLMGPRVFGYGSSTGYNGRWKSICKQAGIPYLSAHPAGRHGYFTELTVRQGVDPVEAAKAGRWSDVALPLKTYAHAEQDEGAIRSRFRTKPAQPAAPMSAKSNKLKRKSRDG
ncbi:site-specific integrase [Salipiger profundus]|uniref:site-specific integrase n=1 Tax=Salipiger profundus TaxID=1229727 RepID=UPI0008DFC34B|nr:site-specific integrase [Salipiger profundus]SFD16775.1 Phage integrase family protein [Salipiger profundus]